MSDQLPNSYQRKKAHYMFDLLLGNNNLQLKMVCKAMVLLR